MSKFLSFFIYLAPAIIIICGSHSINNSIAGFGVFKKSTQVYTIQAKKEFEEVISLYEKQKKDKNFNSEQINEIEKKFELTLKHLKKANPNDAIVKNYLQRANHNLGQFYLYVKKDEKKGVSNLEVASTLGYTKSLTERGFYLLNKSKTEKAANKNFQTSLSEAERLFVQAALGATGGPVDPQAWTVLGQIYDKGGPKTNSDKAKKYYSGAAERGDLYAQFRLGQIYFYEENPKNLEKAKKYFQEVIDNEEAKSHYSSQNLIEKAKKGIQEINNQTGNPNAVPEAVQQLNRAVAIGLNPQNYCVDPQNNKPLPKLLMQLTSMNPSPLLDPIVKPDEEKAGCSVQDLNVNENIERLTKLNFQGKLTDDDRHQRRLFIFLARKISSENKCISRENFDDFVKLDRSVGVSNWKWLEETTFDVLSQIKNNQEKWRNQASKSATTLKFKLNPEGNQSSAMSETEVFVKPNGDLILSHKNSFLAKGGNKQADTRIGISGAGNKITAISPLVALTALDSASEGEIDKELRIYDLINKHKNTLPVGQKLEGLAEAELLALGGGKRALIQRRYDMDLVKSDILQGPNQLPVLGKIATGLAHLHSMGLVHGDFKEANVFIKRDGSEVAISDFGLTFDPRINIQHRSTAHYEAPEMVNQKELSSGNVSKIQKRDIFGFGLIALKSIEPFNDKSENIVLKQKCKNLFKRYTRPGESWGAYGECVIEKARLVYDSMRSIATKACRGKDSKYCKEQIVADCLHPDPDHRPSAADLKSRLEQSAKLQRR